MSAYPAWSTYSPKDLHDQYIVREQVPDFRSFLDRWRETSKPVRAEFPDHLDIRFGDHPAETLDVLLPRTWAPGNPVQVLYHGGYWRALHKDEYAFVALPGLRAGIGAVIVNYELCPNVSMAGLVAQCRRGFAWTVRNIAEFGGDPGNLHLSGHSAGGHLVGSMLQTDWKAFGLGDFTIRGACALSGLFDLTPLPSVENVQNDIRLTPEEVTALSPVAHPIANLVPLVLANGALETAEFHRQTADYAEYARGRGATVEFHDVEGRHHYSVVDALADGDHPLCQAWHRAVLGGSIG